MGRNKSKSIWSQSLCTWGVSAGMDLGRVEEREVWVWRGMLCSLTREITLRYPA